MKTCFIVNPAAGRGGSLRIWEQLKDRIAIPHDVEISCGPGDATSLAKGAVEAGFEKIVSVGGDGTLHEIVNGIAGTDAVLGVIPAGSGNDFARTLGIPMNPLKALKCVEKGVVDYIDLGKYNGAHYINSAGVGFDAEVVRIVNEDMRWLRGSAAYVVSVLAALMRFSPWSAVITVDGRRLERKVWLVAVVNGKFIGGGMMIAPEASLDSGVLELCIVNEMTRVQILRFLPKIFSGGHKDHPAFEVFRGREISISAEVAVPVHVDGETAGTTPVKFSVIPHGIKVVR